MRLRSLIVLGTAALLLVSGCTAEPTPKPTGSPSASASATSTATPTPEAVVEPETAFDVTCDDVAATMAELLGEPATPVEPVLSVVSAMGWLPGPGQHMFQRAGGIACSTGDTERSWEVTIVPDAEAVIAGATERQGFWGEAASCEDGRCGFELPDGDVLLSATVVDPDLGAGDTARIEDALRGIAASAASSTREVEYVDSEIVGAPCERFTTPEQVNAAFGVSDAALFTDFGGWGIPAEVYEVVNGSRICYFKSAGSEYEGSSYLMLTTLPAGAWAFEKLGGDPVEVEGADSAKASTGEHGESIVDVRVGLDWIRMVTFDNGAGAADPAPLAETVVRNLTVGHTAPE
ncbi:hypothetical protein FIV50_13865 [Microbacterium foliorum]|uniref:DUF3558 domain-containing protein n=1 Tax=Microbacterium foliorum TaxID=104336 RepID=A0A4Y5YTV6_9MICO|nr:hypothetical protein [Microbacterium foliorum]QDE35779.1 hypothetical protein FIV50_13865 [Microbacterium foliorum]